MGKVVDTELRVKVSLRATITLRIETNCQQGVQNMRVADASVFPVAITAHLQVATYGMAEQAAVIIGKG